MRFTLFSGLTLGVAGLALAAYGGAAEPRLGAAETVALKAGTIYVVEGDQVITGGGTVLLRDGRIAAVGKDLPIPAGARVVDYGPDVALAPGFVAADSNYGLGNAGQRTAAPGQRAIDGFDPYTPLSRAMRAGVTSVYLAPQRGRLIAGQGAVVKTGGEDVNQRVLSESTGLAGSVSVDARNTQGYWQPILPATVDSGLGLERQQLPATTMGASIALAEIFALAGGDESLAVEYGDLAGPVLAEMVAAKRPWRIRANTPNEIRAVLAAFDGKGVPLIIEGANDAASVAKEIADAGAMVVYVPPAVSTRDFGKGPEVRLPDPTSASRLVEAGVTLAVAPGAEGVDNLTFALSRAMRGGMSKEAALRAVTLNAAMALGVADRVGSLTAGKDADVVALSGHPAEGGAVLANWIGGEAAWQPEADAGFSTVISVDELHLGDGEVLSPGELLISQGRVVEVSSRVSRPVGTTVVRGAAAMPGAVDMLSHLGLEGSQRSFSKRFDLSRIAEAPDAADILVARAGITTVNMGARDTRGDSPTMAYRPAAGENEQMVLRSPASLRMTWDAAIPSQVGSSVRDALAKAAEYKQKWEEYEEAIAKWTPPAANSDEKSKESDEDEDDSDDEEDDDGDKKKKKKRKKGELPPAVAVTGTWPAELLPAGTLEARAEAQKDKKSKKKKKDEEEAGDDDAAQDASATEEVASIKARLRLLESEDGSLTGTLRTADEPDLVMLSGTRDEYSVTLEGEAVSGGVSLALELTFDEDDESILFLKGTRSAKGVVMDFSSTRQSTEYPVAKRPESKPPVAAPKAPKGKPKQPGINPDLEPLRQAMMGKCAVIVSVSGRDRIVDCVDAFAKYNVKPVLYGASGVTGVAGTITGRVSGVLLSGATVSEGKGLVQRNRMTQLQSAGIPVGFFSLAEEGAAGLLDVASFAVARGMSSVGAVKALTGDAATMLRLEDHVGHLKPGAFADVILLDGAPLVPSSRVLRVWVGGVEVR